MVKLPLAKANLRAMIEVADDTVSKELRTCVETVMTVWMIKASDPAYPDFPVPGHYCLTVIFSVTFPKSIRKVAEEFLRDPVFVTIGKSGGANEDIVQVILLVPAYAKYEKLHKLLTNDERVEDCAAGRKLTDKSLVFVERKAVSDCVTARLAEMGVLSRSIHGDREQREREDALRDFKSGRCRILIATAVAARGLDIVVVDNVINFDLPSRIEDYVHRIGRPGRVGNTGRAVSFCDPASDKQMVRPLLHVIPDWLLEENAPRNSSKSPKTGGPYEKSIKKTPSKKR